MGEVVSFAQAKYNLESIMLLAQLKRHAGNVSKVAAALDIERNTVYSWILKHNINIDNYRSKCEESDSGKA